MGYVVVWIVVSCIRCRGCVVVWIVMCCVKFGLCGGVDCGELHKVCSCGGVNCDELHKVWVMWWCGLW